MTLDQPSKDGHTSGSGYPSIDGGDRHQQLALNIRRAQECAQCGRKLTVVVTKARSYREQVAFCAACLSEMLCALCNKTHRRKR